MLKLNLGCGNDIRKGYCNIDSRKLPGVDLNADVKQLPFKEETVDEILASDVYEHVSHRDSLDLLEHWTGLLKEDGVLIIRAPCLDTILQCLLNATDLEQIQIGINALYGEQEYNENSHYTICQSNLTTAHLESVGMKDIKYKMEDTNIIFRAIKTKGE